MDPITQNAIGGFIANGAYGVLTLVISRVKEEIKLARYCKEELQQLEGQLNGLNDLLQPPLLLSTNNGLLNNWLNKVTNAAYNVDDLLDDYLYDDLKHKTRTQKRYKLIDLMIFPIQTLNFGHRAKALRIEIDSILKEGRNLGIKLIQVPEISHHNPEHRLQDRREWPDDQDLVGRDHDLTVLANFLCDPTNYSKDLSVFGIVGLPGVGKTALSKRVAEERKVKRHFKSLIFWLGVSHSCNLTDILKKMVEQLSGSPSNMSDSRAMVRKLQQKLNGKRYLLILDDVWDTINWEPLRSAIHEIGGTKGTSLLVTSCDKNVFEKMYTYSTDTNGHKAVIHKLEGLNKDDSWSLLLGGEGDNLETRRQEIASRMVIKCGGIPQAIRAVRDLLRDKGVEEWCDIEKNIDRYLYDILPSLKLSYIHLPSMALKKCFSYCAIFEEDEVIQKDRLIQLWMAQGLLQPYDENMERTGNEYVNKLLNYFLFQDPKLDMLGNVISFKMHHLVLSLARNASGEECLNLQDTTKVKNSSMHQLRHLSTSLPLSGELITSKFRENLRTYYYCCPQFAPEMSKSLEVVLKHSRCLRVLCLEHLGLENLPNAIGDLKHLRYLDISKNCFGTLPVVITSLYHLQTLRIDYNTHCELLSSLPKEKVSNLINLRHISAKSVDIGILEGLSHLTALQTLPAINLKIDWGGKVNELGSLSNLRSTIVIRGLECMKSSEESTSLNLGRKKDVYSLVLEWSENKTASEQNHQNQILEGLKPHKELAILEVAHFNGSRFPGWLMGMTVVKGSQRFSKLASLTLRNCFYAKGNLNLKNHGSLRFLSLESCYNLTITLPENGFHCCNMLESLKLSSCFMVGNLGDLSPLTRLQYLEIKNCDPTDSTYELVGLASLPCVEELITDKLLPSDLGKDSPICKSLRSLYMSTQSGKGDFPVQIQHLVALKKLQIYDFKGMKTLPEWVGKLTSLYLLELSSMPSLKQLPSEEAMQGLSELKILSVRECPSLQKQFASKSVEWFKINHIPSIIF